MAAKPIVRYCRTMRPSTEDLSTFVQVVDCGTITAAAARMSLAKSVVSKRIAHLETTVSAKLLHRSARRVTPTDTGALLYDRARALLAQLDAMSDEVAARSGDLQGLIRLAAPMSFGTRHLARLIARFMQDNPRVEIALDLDDRHVDLQGGGYDLGVRIGRLGDSALRARRLGASRRALCCSPAYANAAGLPATLEALAAHSCLGYANAAAGHIWRFASSTEPAEPRSIVLHGRLTANSGETLLEAACAGLGLVVLPTFVVGDAMRAGDLISLSIAGWTPVPDAIQVVYPETSAMPSKVRALIDFLVANLREPFDWDEGIV
ncbi:LysR family transcriptional regulator [Acidisoma cladoniae]|uniref:LysR family transcriptional regulator n=1 Tax=Acidisoma cladoniae TaxID=3040935 RepID=UPI00254D9077|nr:LysR family transcriptional regulator [Acidisoma sp. PAMC 29798]